MAPTLPPPPLSTPPPRQQLVELLSYTASEWLPPLAGVALQKSRAVVTCRTGARRGKGQLQALL